jgi:hypothetical protein
MRESGTTLLRGMLEAQRAQVVALLGQLDAVLQILAPVTNPEPCPHDRAQEIKTMDGFVGWYCSDCNSKRFE